MESKWWVYRRNFSHFSLISYGASLASRYDYRNISRPMATLLNANGDLVSAMLVTRIAEGKMVVGESNCLTKSINSVCFLNPDKTVFIGVFKGYLLNIIQLITSFLESFCLTK
jgi:hypothetical protein